MTTAALEVDEQQARAQVLGALKRSKGRVTVGDVAAATGLGSAQAEGTLRALMTTHRGHMEVGEEGDIVYRFDPRLLRRDQRSAWEKLRKAAWAAFKLAFKIGILVMLVVYFIVYVVLILAAITASSSRSSSRRRGGFPLRLDWLFLLFYTSDYRWGTPFYGDQHAEVRVPFYAKLFAFVFGPDERKIDPLERERRLLALIRRRKGVLTAAELMAHTGQSRQEADEELGRLMGAHDGDIEVSDYGELIYTFESLALSTDSTAGALPPPHAWNALEPKAALTGNKGTTNALIIFLNGFNLLAAASAPVFIFPELGLYGPAVWIGLFWVPLLFSLTLFAVPLLRAIPLRVENARRAARNARRALLRVVFDSVSPLPPDAVTEPAALALATSTLQRAALPASQSLLRKKLSTMAVELSADVEPTDEGVVSYRFGSVSNALEASKTFRERLRLSERKVGEIVYSTADTPEQEQERLGRQELKAFDEALQPGAEVAQHVEESHYVH